MFCATGSIMMMKVVEFDRFMYEFGSLSML